MNSGWIGGLVPILSYSTGSDANEESKALITEDGFFNIQTENSLDILTET